MGAFAREGWEGLEIWGVLARAWAGLDWGVLASLGRILNQASVAKAGRLWKCEWQAGLVLVEQENFKVMTFLRLRAFSRPLQQLSLVHAFFRRFY